MTAKPTTAASAATPSLPVSPSATPIAKISGRLVKIAPPACAITLETASGSTLNLALPTPNKIPAAGSTDTGSTSDFPIFCSHANAPRQILIVLLLLSAHDRFIRDGGRRAPAPPWHRPHRAPRERSRGSLASTVSAREPSRRARSECRRSDRPRPNQRAPAPRPDRRRARRTRSPTVCSCDHPPPSARSVAARKGGAHRAAARAAGYCDPSREYTASDRWYRWKGSRPRERTDRPSPLRRASRP